MEGVAIPHTPDGDAPARMDSYNVFVWTLQQIANHTS